MGQINVSVDYTEMARLANNKAAEDFRIKILQRWLSQRASMVRKLAECDAEIAKYNSMTTEDLLCEIPSYPNI